MSREVHLVFSVDDDSTLSDEELYDLGDQIAAQVDPDPPVLTFEEVRVALVST